MGVLILAVEHIHTYFDLSFSAEDIDSKNGHIP